LLRRPLRWASSFLGSQAVRTHVSVGRRKLGLTPSHWPVKSPRATDCANIFSSAGKSLIRLHGRILRATDKHCFFCVSHVIMQGAMLQDASISGILNEPVDADISHGLGPCAMELPISPTTERLYHASRSAMHLQSRLLVSESNPIEIPPQIVGYPISIPSQIVGYPTVIPSTGWDIPWDLVGSRDVSPLNGGIGSKTLF
jgi:hypothetical protein